ncbi:ATP12 family chaperone protein [Tropicimonas marinistellae]|uniref:ATP12 family chaperone protein n=1 Tax=Tropicimonas marinistellae TaxID=1739787 RepID=UPI000833085F|nr:ATP12 family protein [Tropicimonas marinistellae]
MAEWKAKRFWKRADITECDGGWGVSLDGRPLRTPAKAVLLVPTRPLAREIAAEWDAQAEVIDPLSMPFTRSANAAIDKVAPQFAEVAGLIAAYGETDLCCYRAEGPDRLFVQQAEAWDPMLEWARSAIGAALVPTAGIVPVAQPAESLSRLRQRVEREDVFALTALHDLVSLTGSLVLGLAAIEGILPADEIWQMSRIDEAFQESQWGVDETAAAEAEIKRQAFLHAARFHELSRVSPES